jgi:hypothetical protein
MREGFRENLSPLRRESHACLIEFGEHDHLVRVRCSAFPFNSTRVQNGRQDSGLEISAKIPLRNPRELHEGLNAVRMN